MGNATAPAQAGDPAYKRIGYIHEGDKFIYDRRGKPTDKPVYIRVGLPAQAGEAEPVAVEPLPFRGPIEKAMELADAYADGPHELGYYGRRRTELFEFLSFVLSHASPFYLGGPYAATGEFAICETATGRVLRRFRDERDLLTTPASSPEDKRDAERLEWLMHRLSGKELRRLGIETSSGGPYWTRIAIDSARSTGKGE